MPKFGLTMVEGTIQQWFKAAGEAIKAGEPLFEVETEKVLYQVEAPVAGTVAKLLYPLEAVVPVGLPIAVIAEAGENVAEVAARYGDGASAAKAAVASAPAAASPAPAAASASGRREGAPVTPAARKLAEEHKIDLARLVGTGPGGRVTREDVQKVIDAGGQAHISVGVAVALDEGLIVPVIHHTDKKSLKEIAQEARSLAEKARAGKLALEEVSGGTFTVSNLGMYGVDGFTPILNTPQTGILGVGRIIEKPAIYHGEIAKRAMLVLSLTFDHRVIDGAPAGAFLQTVADLLAHGNRISLDVR